jgi:hypothetical protein
MVLKIDLGERHIQGLCKASESDGGASSSFTAVRPVKVRLLVNAERDPLLIRSALAAGSEKKHSAQGREHCDLK